MVEQVGVTRAKFCFGAHALLGSACGVMAFVFQKFIGIDAFELTAGILVILLETLAQCTGQRITLDLPELGYPYVRLLQMERF